MGLQQDIGRREDLLQAPGGVEWARVTLEGNVELRKDRGTGHGSLKPPTLVFLIPFSSSCLGGLLLCPPLYLSGPWQ